ncbi:MAG: C1 family peptidase [Fimbriimonadaceae bacterium]|nr:C1 family peptidase [Fimbriimonadaceae bacterium]
MASPEVTPEQIAAMQRAFDADPRNRQAMNAVCTTPVSKVALSRRKLTCTPMTFSVQLPENKITSQNGSGRCWLFAALNTLRGVAIKNMNLGDDFEISQNHTMFWDKFEKANYFLESVLQTLDEPTDGRLIAHLFQAPIQDGGQWHMFTNLVAKHGLVPKTVMPETESSSSTGQMNWHVTLRLREFGCRLREAHANGASLDELRGMKPAMLETVYRMLCIHLGEPPTEFEWQWRDKDKAFHRDGVLTPQEFYRRHIDVNLADMVCLIHCPQASKRFDEVYTIKFLGNVVGGEPIKYLNVSLDVIKQAAIQQLQNGEPVWFGCDVGKYLDRDLGWMDDGLFDFDLVYGSRSTLDKASRLDYGESLMTHAMVFTGVDLGDDGKPRKWRVENSWGEKGGDKGFYGMADTWFDQFLYEVVVHRHYLPEGCEALLEREPIGLEPWDPMGSLAMVP